MLADDRTSFITPGLPVEASGLPLTDQADKDVVLLSYI